MSSQETTTEMPPRVEPYIRALGLDGAVDLILKFGGQTILIPSKPRGKSVLEDEIGRDKAEALRVVFGNGKLQVPVAKSWVAQQLDAKGHTRLEIAKMLHVTRQSVRNYLAPTKPKAAA
ncbi:helix-turn-helix domain-containing protein [Methylobacterium sp. Leaf85]|uniref:helix-turn-helix domain-containing protein n=1 Tax=Methylobacterium sp. Leaf85 TaxID=1736241 RepID=UPI0012E841C1|nr:helix-turn-helix domain-containing protein [Methylobacterium sp. Leaf85]